MIYNNPFCALLIFFPSVVKLYMSVTPVNARGSDQPESLSYFGHWAHFIFRQLCNSFSLFINVLL